MSETLDIRTASEIVRQLQAEMGSASRLLADQYVGIQRALAEVPTLNLAALAANIPTLSAFKVTELRIPSSVFADMSSIKSLADAFSLRTISSLAEIANSPTMKALQETVEAMRSSLFDQSAMKHAFGPLPERRLPDIDFAEIMQTKEAREEAMIRRVVREELERLTSNEDAPEEPPLYGSDGQQRKPGFDLGN